MTPVSWVLRVSRETLEASWVPYERLECFAGFGLLFWTTREWFGCLEGLALSVIGRTIVLRSIPVRAELVM